MNTDPRPEILVVRTFTLAGRVLLLLVIVGVAAAILLFFLDVFPYFPAGNYPVFILVVPILIGGAILFLVLAILLEKLRIPVYRRKAADR